MMLMGILCLVATAVALPVIPDALLRSGVIMFENDLHTNVPEVVEVSADVKDVKNDESKEGTPNKVILLRGIPEAPELPPLDANILKTVQRMEEKEEEEKEFDEDINSETDGSDDEEDVKEEEIKEEKSKEEELKEEPEDKEPKEEEPKKDDVKVTIEEVKEKPVADSKKPTIVKWQISRPSFLNHIFPFHLPSISNVWPFRGTSILAHPRIGYPGYVVDQI